MSAQVTTDQFVCCLHANIDKFHANMCACSITANCLKPHSSDPYRKIRRIWASYIFFFKYSFRYISESPQIFEYLAGSDFCLGGQIADNLCQRQFGCKIQPQVLTYSYLQPLSPHHHTSSPYLITTPHHHTSSPYLITIPPNLIGRKETCSQYNNLTLTHTVIEKLSAKCFETSPCLCRPATR